MLYTICAGIIVYVYDCAVHVCESLSETRSTCDCVCMHARVCLHLCVGEGEEEWQREREEGKTECTCAACRYCKLYNIAHNRWLMRMLDICP